MESHFFFTYILILSRDRRLEKIESKDGWAVADKIDHFFNEVDVVAVVVVVSCGVVHVVGLVQCPCCCKDNDDLEIVRFIDERRRPPRKQQRG